MKRKLITIVGVSLCSFLMNPIATSCNNLKIYPIENVKTEYNEEYEMQCRLDSKKEVMQLAIENTEDTQEQIKEEIYLGELELLAQLVMAEAGNQDLTGKRLVVDVVLNRVDSPDYPDSITEVIFQKYHFSSLSDGNFDEAAWTITDDCFEAVRMETSGTRLDNDILYFTADKYGRYGVPAYKHGNHYFSY
jgi:spore germination cell wall hydrolase CwlJ-like protein